ncbi:hypothetical protein BpHYR1_006927, partial [Brachionus plicatilis]
YFSVLEILKPLMNRYKSLQCDKNCAERWPQFNKQIIYINKLDIRVQVLEILVRRKHHGYIDHNRYH